MPAETLTVKTPWYDHSEGVPVHLTYPDISMVEMVDETAKKHPDVLAYTFYSTKVTYAEFVKQIDLCAKSLCAMGIKPGDKVTICMPNTPQAVIMFYAVNRIGAISNMIHPLSGEEEIAFYLNSSESVIALTLRQFYPKFDAIREKINIKKLIITGIEDALSGPMKLGYSLTQGRKIAKVPADDTLVLGWKEFLKGGGSYTGSYAVPKSGSDTATILYSGGTTGTTKGILLSNLNFNALGLQTAAAGNCLVVGHKMLSIMPIFHGFGLGVCIHTVLIYGGTCILVPQFTVESYAELLKKHKPNYIAGVPTLYEALLRLKQVENLDMSQLEGVFSGGDSLSIELKHKVDAFLKSHGSKEQIREGYGTTECVTASCLTPKDSYKEGSIGIPFPDTYYKIVIPSTHDEVPYGQVGEICISGPTVMQGYNNQPKETAQTLQLHEDGLVWLHTGDLGSMDEEGFIYFKQRLKRMIITSGYNVYPSQVENVIDAHESVLMSTVIGVHDDYKMQRVKAFVVLKPGIEPSKELEDSIREHCKKHIARYAIPKEIEFRDSLPKTLVGKIAYTVLEREEAEKQAKE
ncbi:MAG: AMP-binding protein [Oscillospiraceae bacterium]|nr:AMP-binding protein [Oscillospiraceae bacterium]